MSQDAPADLPLLGLQAELRGLELIMASLAAMGTAAKGVVAGLNAAAAPAAVPACEDDFDNLPV
jgi:hypothetical protein